MEVMESFLIIDNQVTCKFCQGKCNNTVQESKTHSWWDCNTCQVGYLLSRKGELSITQFKSTLENNKFYTIHLLFKSNQSLLYVWIKAEEPGAKSIESFYQQKMITDFPYLLDLTPQNFPNKLKTILTFL